MARYIASAPAVYHDEDALTVCLEALAAVRRALPSMLALPGAERHCDDAGSDVESLSYRLDAARKVCRAEIARLEAAEVVS